jgi:lysozyme
MWNFILKLLGKKKAKAKAPVLAVVPKEVPSEKVVVEEKPKDIDSISEVGLDLIKEYEGLSLTPYLCSADVPTIGYGSTFYEDGTKVTLQDPEITKERAEDLLRFHANSFCKKMLPSVKVKLTQYQLDALVSFAYNVGVGNFKSSTLLKMLNKSDFEGASNEFPRWNKAGGKIVSGLTRRRLAERKMFIGK